MLSDAAYAYLRALLTERDFVFPERAIFMFSHDFSPVHLQCHQTAMQVAIESGWPPVVGIQFIDLRGKLYPWPHMVNRRQDGVLVDCSPKPDHPVLGFIETGWAEFAEWRQVIADYDALGAYADKPCWGDALADRLSEEFLHPIQSALMAGAPRIV